MIRSIFINHLGEKETDLSLPEMKEALKDTQGMLWVSLEHPTEAEFDLDLAKSIPLSSPGN